MLFLHAFDMLHSVKGAMVRIPTFRMFLEAATKTWLHLLLIGVGAVGVDLVVLGSRPPKRVVSVEESCYNIAQHVKWQHMRMAFGECLDFAQREIAQNPPKKGEIK